jgi:hypothetical protein
LNQSEPWIRHRGKAPFLLAKNIHPPGCPQGCDANFAYRSAAFRLTAGGALPKSAVSADLMNQLAGALKMPLKRGSRPGFTPPRIFARQPIA